MTGRRALVVGGTGPTGPAIVNRLLAAGYETTIYHSGAHEVDFDSDVEHLHGDNRDGDDIAAKYGIRGTPGLLLVDVHGDIVYRRVGGDAPESVESMLRERLGLDAKSSREAR